MGKSKVSVVIPTYSGLRTIEGVLKSISEQKEASTTEVVVIIDGPNQQLREVVDRFFGHHSEVFSSFFIKQFDQNKGRFAARREGALSTTTNNLIFIDDRTELTPGYLKSIEKLREKHKVIISNILEKSQPNFVSKTLFFIRNTIYKDWGKEFRSYEITTENFDKSPKGTAGLYIEKDIFLKSVDDFLLEYHGGTKQSNDDTKLLKKVLSYSPLYRSSEPKLMYLPRDNWKDELIHIYARGPLFVDYYLKVHSPYFLHLVTLYATIILLILVLIFAPFIILPSVLFICLLALLVGLIAKGSLLDRLGVGAGLITIPIFFTAGVLKGTITRAIKRLLPTN